MSLILLTTIYYTDDDKSRNAKKVSIYQGYVSAETQMLNHDKLNMALQCLKANKMPKTRDKAFKVIPSSVKGEVTEKVSTDYFLLYRNTESTDYRRGLSPFMV